MSTRIPGAVGGFVFVCLQVPFAVRSHLVNWIDSKATFGSDYTHLCATLLSELLASPSCSCTLLSVSWTEHDHTAMPASALQCSP